MSQLGSPLLSMAIFAPLAGAVVALGLGGRRRILKLWALLVTLLALALFGVMFALFDYGQSGLQFVDRFDWIEPLGISYNVGIDGISLWFLLLTAFLCPVVLLVSWRFLDELPVADAKMYVAFVLLLESGVLGVFAAADLILFFVFWEAVLIPMYFLIGRWGGERREYASLKFVLYTMAGSALMLVAILALAALNYQATSQWTFDLASIYQLPLGWWTQILLFLAFGLAFAVKAPIWPLHTWLPDAYVEAITPVTLLLAGVLSKMAIYGLIRFCIPLFPDAVQTLRTWIWLLAILGVLYGALVALVQRDLKRLIAYSSLAHMGMMVAGVFASNVQGLQGAIVFSVSHGLTVSALFVFVGLLERRRGTRLVDDYGGLWKSIPLLGTLFLTVVLASIGLPGLSGFPGEFTLLIGVFQESSAAAVLATLGIILGAWYMLDMFRKTFVGPIKSPENRSLPDLSKREAAILIPLILLILLFGILPNLLIRPTDASVHDVLNTAVERSVVQLDDPDAIALRQNNVGAVGPTAGVRPVTKHSLNNTVCATAQKSSDESCPGKVAKTHFAWVERSR